MSEPDKTRISVQIGKTTEEQVRFQYERHLRTFTICSVLDANASEPGFEQQASQSQSSKKARPFGARGQGLPGLSTFTGPANLVVCYFACFLLEL